MSIDIPSEESKQIQPFQEVGTLAIDLGSSTTVVAFQGEKDPKAQLLSLPPITRLKGEVPSLVWYSEEEKSSLLIGQEVFELGLTNQESSKLNSDFKRWIGSNSPNPSDKNLSNLSPEKAGELLLKGIWNRLPPNLYIKRLVLTAPVETYRSYREWLNQVCIELPVEEIALVDEPTAAAMGADLPPGSKLLVVDLGGSTIDLSIVALEGGEGKAEPVAQLIRFGGQDLEKTSTQVLRCAKVLGKSGLRLGGRDIDRWIANHLYPENHLTEELLNTAERLKCRLSEESLKETESLIEIAYENQPDKTKHLCLSKMELEELLIEKGFLTSFSVLLEQTLANGRANGCNLQDLRGVVAVGGGSRIPLLKRWLQEQTKPAPLLTPPPVEAVAIGALRLTPGVKVRDVLQRGVSLRCWDQRSKQHIWHPLFLAGQPWPTTKPLEIILAASKLNQIEIELVIGEPEMAGAHEVIYIDGIPTIKTLPSEPQLRAWQDIPTSISLNPQGQPGEDCLRLKFSVDENSQLVMNGLDLRSGEEIKSKSLGSIR